MKENLLVDKSIAFAARIVKLQQHLVKDKKEKIINESRIVKNTKIFTASYANT